MYSRPPSAQAGGPRVARRAGFAVSRRFGDFREHRNFHDPFLAVFGRTPEINRDRPLRSPDSRTLGPEIAAAGISATPFLSGPGLPGTSPGLVRPETAAGAARLRRPQGDAGPLRPVPHPISGTTRGGRQLEGSQGPPQDQSWEILATARSGQISGGDRGESAELGRGIGWRY